MECLQDVYGYDDVTVNNVVLVWRRMAVLHVITFLHLRG